MVNKGGDVMLIHNPDCLFEGAAFDDLLAHIGRRHPNATPDDFVPGLIHHRPLYSPPTVNDLPKLPQLTIISTDPNERPKSIWACGDLPGCSTEITARTVRYVVKGCMSGNRPRKDHHVEKEGASAAISAIIDNSRRISELYESTHHDEPEEGMVETPLTARSVPMTADEAKDQGLELVDIRHYVKKAKQMAKKQMANDLDVDVDASSESATGSRPSSRNAHSIRPSLKIRLSGLRTSKGNEREGLLSESESDSDTSASSRFSLYKGTKGLTGVSPVVSDGEAAAVKRSERLRRKAGEAGDSPIERMRGTA